MRQFQIEYSDDQTVLKNLKKVSMWCRTNVISNEVFHIFTEKTDKYRINKICDMILAEFPNAKLLGCSTNGNVQDGGFTRRDTIICTAYEYPTTKVELLQFEMTEKTEKKVTDSLIQYVKDNPWVKAIELLTTIRGMSMTKFCDHLKALPSDVQVFGGGAFSEEINDDTACVFTSVGSYMEKSIAFMLVGGEDFHVTTSFIAGWKPLGRELIVTKADGAKLIELDGKPAYDTYYKYLKINNDVNFFRNTLEFPFFYEHAGINILRAPTASTEDGCLMMTSDMEENVKARIAYGDPWTILTSIKNEARRFSSFEPETVAIFSCAARRTFWGDADVGKELMPFQLLAPTYGFYTSSEFLRTGENVIQHNVTLVIAAMREGDVPENAGFDYLLQEGELQGSASMINRLANFIQAATEELEEANKQLSDMAITDGLTKLYNRKEIQRRIYESTENAGDKPVSLIMMDIDDFKHVNDTYGHAEGDNVLIGLSDMIRNVIKHNAPECFAGRWGGEEFMILLPGYDMDSSSRIAEIMRNSFSHLKFEKAGSCTMSLGVVTVKENENPDTSCMRVDNALYKAKSSGKNCVVTG